MADKHAIVIGGSMAGMCAARVLTESFDKVTIIDRDSYPDGAHERAGVPQSRHVHALLKRGRIELENLFPGFDQTMLSRGALEINFGFDFAALRADGWSPRRHDKITTLFASRVLIEAVVRELLRKTGKVKFIERTEATGFEVERGPHLRATGVKIRPRDGGAASSIRADLIADVSGRASRITAWLAEIGLPAPEETVVDSHSGYASRWYKAAPQRRPQEWWWKAIWIDPIDDDVATAGVLFPVEGERFIVTMAGIGGKYPPTDEEGFTKKLPQLRSPIIAEEVALAEPISAVYSYRQMANRWRHYEKWQSELGGFVALGDSVCAFNPVYGQGMTSGAISSLILRDCLKKYGPSDPQFPKPFFTAQARFQSEPWGLATGADFRFPGTEGKRPIASRIFDPIFGKLFDLQKDDDVIRERVGDVINMLLPPAALAEPAMLARIATGAVRRMIRGKPAGQPVTPMPPRIGETVAA
ncbi:MAG TPA: FAD-dependent monooxygenase [Candidatus Binataceae bacterium]